MHAFFSALDTSNIPTNIIQCHDLHVHWFIKHNWASNKRHAHIIIYTVASGGNMRIQCCDYGWVMSSLNTLVPYFSWHSQSTCPYRLWSSQPTYQMGYQSHNEAVHLNIHSFRHTSHIQGRISKVAKASVEEVISPQQWCQCHKICNHVLLGIKQYAQSHYTH